MEDRSYPGLASHSCRCIAGGCFMMQIAKWFGVLTGNQVNRWLLKKGIKEKL